ncbi:MAG: tyrosine--tRNA ligase [Candidatus Hydrogenedentes bacterium]|nr:tyrosine--tRNA ligase [Candidatus Hydrogenedentota bacterium]
MNQPAAVPPEVQDELSAILNGTEDIITQDNLVAKLKRFHKDGVPLKVKAGFDPTAPDIHIGHAVALRKMRQLQDMGHEIICVVGDFTARIGDPSGRSDERPHLSKEDVLANAETYFEQVTKILDPEKTRIVPNSRWFDKMQFDSVIDLGARYTVARLLERDDFSNRFKAGAPISVLELFYPLVQAYDSVALKADIEMGGTDQTFNLLVGRDIMRSYGLEPQVVLTMPLLVGLDGVEKMSKSKGNYIGINEPPREMFGKTMSIPDEIMLTYYEMCTDLGPAEIETVRNGLADGSLHPRDAKKQLAHFIVAMYHGDAAARDAENEFERVFKNGGLFDDIAEFTITEPTVGVIDLLRRTGLAATNSEARRLIAQRGVRVDGEPVADIEAQIDMRDGMIVQRGKRRFVRIRFGSAD